jgi:hypothetical protein
MISGSLRFLGLVLIPNTGSLTLVLGVLCATELTSLLLIVIGLMRRANLASIAPEGDQ